jgi:plastocyanin
MFGLATGATDSLHLQISANQSAAADVLMNNRDHDGHPRPTIHAGSRTDTPMKLHTASLAVITAALVAVGCSSDTEPAATPATEPTEETATAKTEAATDGPTIQIEGFAFSTLDPVAPGAEISVANLDGAQHTLTADDGSFNTGGLDGGATIAITAPDAPGTYTFVCNIHPSMTGSLTVEG